ncbi:hypothetical protein QFZ36_003759 [Pseudarthrobacter siccitolerans]|uniref:Mucin-associated surface protein n=1 Tax=Pseudarthrobacter siccitolerans TaxID=861266 RepID=A0ABU0PQE1_9MICC|nr:hypothetical protein [Pseudarthrobacter siccitolerans]MDQ0676198.1 hypothetical protein [Pseudarthrobacter siccitolerans]
MSLMHIRGWPHSRAMVWTAAALAAGLLAGCGTNDAGLQPSAARQLQARVLEVSEASSRNDPAAALKALENLDADLAAAQSKGQVSEERRQTITTIAAAVRADLNEAAAAAAKAAEDARIAEQAAAAAQASQKAAQNAAYTPAPAQAPAPPATGNGDDKKGNEDKGKGKD